MTEQGIQELLDKLSIFEKMYDFVRIVDPLNKKVIGYQNNETVEMDSICSDFWEKDMVCENCISIRAYNSNKTIVKIEHGPNKVYMVTAIPIELNNRRFVIEVLKNITDSLFFSDMKNEKISSEIYTMIGHMNNLVVKDPLTNIYNRRFIEEKLPVDLINSALNEQHIAVIMADIDYFKRINDTYGHQAGDRVLKSFTATISDCLRRDNDWVARYGGEEFLICLPGASMEVAVNLAEKIGQETEAREVVHNDRSIRITASFGIYAAIPTQTDQVESFINNADKKLYEAKNNGRNRVAY